MRSAANADVSLLYLDASALVKLLRVEPETAALQAFLADADLATSELVLTEVPRAARRAAADDSALALDDLVHRVEELLDALAIVPLERPLLLTAGAFAEPGLRSLDAIHLAAAIEVSPLDAFVSYDERQAAAARLAGLRTVAPGT
jgi:predicted nucleic acid-binding protein